MPKVMQDLIEQYIEAVKKIYGSHVRQIILYGSYARGDFRSDLDVDIMILLDLSDLDEYSCAVTPQVRQTGNRLSGLAGTAYASLLT